MRRAVAVLVAALAGSAPPRGAEAQATGMPSYNAPYRAFQRSELGGVFSFPEGGGTAFEGVYRYASGKFDIGLRGGFFDPGSGFKTVVLAGGADFRLSRVLDARVSGGLGDRPLTGVSIGAVWVH